jgi:DNA adenine methylase
VSFSAFPYIGSKTFLAPWIVDNLRSHENFVVPFGGAAGVLLNKPRSSCEIYNDRDENLVHFFETARHHTEELAEAVRDIPYSRALYEEWSQAFRYNRDEWPEDDVERAARWLFLRYASFSGRYGHRAGFATDTPRGGPQKSRIWQRVPERIETIRERFRGVAIENLDYIDVFKKYDESGTLFYCDPPYLEAHESYYTGDEFDHSEFVQSLKAIEGDWVVSYSDAPDGLEEIATTARTRPYSRSAGHENETRDERLFLSYEPHTVPMFVDKSTSQTTLLEATNGGESA